MIDLTTKIHDHKVREKAIKRFRERGILLPTFAQMRNPELIPQEIKDKLKGIGLWELNPLNLFRITWKNEPIEQGGGFGKVNYIELPSALTGVKARIILIVGKWFPTGAHKVGAAYGCLAPRIITGQFDPTKHKAVWPSTGNYCRGGAFDSYLMGCESVAILPEEMSRERFDWLKEIGAEIFATPGCESNVKEIYDKCWELRRTQPDYIILNQFDEFGNPVWHYNVTGPALEETFGYIKSPKSNLAAYVSNTGSAGSIAAGDYLRTKFPHLKIVASEALQCPTLFNNGFGGHRIEGIGDKHIPWVHNVKETDLVTAIDDEDCMRIMRLFNDKEGKKLLLESGVDAEVVDNLHLLGISAIANLLAAIKTAKYFEYTEDDVILSLATDSMEMYMSRMEEENQLKGPYSTIQAAKDFDRCLLGQGTEYLKELTYSDRKVIHNLKYFTWVEQQEKDVKDLNRLWYDRELWPQLFAQAGVWDEMIEEFNNEVVKSR
jgi:cysteine synthase